MRELPVLFNTQMVKSVIDGSKTATRRPVKADLNKHLIESIDTGEAGEEYEIQFEYRNDVHTDDLKPKRIPEQWFWCYYEEPEYFIPSILRATESRERFCISSRYCKTRFRVSLICC